MNDHKDDHVAKDRQQLSRMLFECRDRLNMTLTVKDRLSLIPTGNTRKHSLSASLDKVE